MNVAEFYDHHPISERQVLAAVARRNGGAGGALRPEDLFDFDQDHYGGVAAVETLARRTGITAVSRVLDVGCGLGGPARFLAATHGCRVIAVELHGGRAAGAARLSRLVGLDARVAVVRGDAAALPFAAGGFHACVSQEGLLHVDDKAAVLRECRRVLAPGGRLVFTDWVARPRLADRERRQLHEWTAAVTLQTLDGYRGLLGRAGFGAIEVEDIADEWRPVLRARFDRYRALPDGGGEALRIYAFFVGLVEAGKLGGGRFSGTA